MSPLEISAANWVQIWVPPGFAHGYVTLEPDCEIIYKVTDYYARRARPASRGMIRASGSTGGSNPPIWCCPTRTGANPTLAEITTPFAVRAHAEHGLNGADAMRLFVTGGAGFIGSAVCRHLVSDLGHEIVVIDKPTYAANLASLAPISNSPLYRLEQVDICDAPRIAQLFETYQPDGVIHLAAESHVDRSITGSRVFVDTNVIGTFTLLEAARAYLAGAEQGPSRHSSGSSMSPPTRSTARLASRTACSSKTPPTTRARPIRRPRPRPIIWPRPGIAPTACR